MSKPFDATLKGMLEAGPADWAAFVGFPGRQVDIVDADVSTFSGASDKVLRVRDKPDWLLDINFQSGPDASLPGRMLLYNALLGDRHGLRVRSVAVLLARKANLSAIDGRYVQQFPGEGPYLDFRYEVIRVWELPVRPLLDGGLATLPLAPLADVDKNELPAVVERLANRVRGLSQGRDFLAATFVLMGLRFEKALIRRLLEGVGGMEESVTYQYIIGKGKALGEVSGERRALLLLGTKRFGEPSTEVVAALEGISKPARLDQLALRLLEVNSWEELLATPEKPKPRRRKR